MKKNFKKSKFVILPALATLVLTGVASVTGTVAWFTANRAVTVSGMSFTAKSGSNLLIAADTLENATQLADDKFASSMKQTVTGDLNPASTIDAKNFFYTNSAKADGNKDTGDYTKVESNTTNYYKDYVFELKAINVDKNIQNIYVDSLDIKYGTNPIYATGDLVNSVKAFRAAFFIETANSKAFTLGTATDTNEVKSIYKPDGAKNQNQALVDHASDTPKAVNSTTTTADVTYNSEQTSLTTVKGESTEYFKGICRIWLEGEDVNCTNELFSTATENWSVTLGLSLGTNDEMKATETTGSVKPAIKNIKVA